MKDLIIGIIIGALLTSGVFFYSLQVRKVERIEKKLESITDDIHRINQKVGPLPAEKVRKK